VTHFFTLLGKDVKSSWKLYGALIAIHIGIALFIGLSEPTHYQEILSEYTDYRGVHHEQVRYYGGIKKIIWFMNTLFPFIMFSMLYREEKNNTAFQLISLPVTPFASFLSKLLCSLGWGAIHVGCVLGWLTMINLKTGRISSLFTPFIVHGRSLLIVFLFLSAGWTLSQLSRKYRIIMGAVGVVAVYMVLIVIQTVKKSVMSLDFFYDNRLYPHSIIISEMLFLTVVCIGMTVLLSKYYNRWYEI
jgi:hypothetical protein